LGCKSTQEKRYAVVDASMAEVIRPSLYGAVHQIFPSTHNQDGDITVS